RIEHRLLASAQYGHVVSRERCTRIRAGHGKRALASTLGAEQGNATMLRGNAASVQNKRTRCVQHERHNPAKSVEAALRISCNVVAVPVHSPLVRLECPHSRVAR